MHTYVGGRKADLPRKVGPTPEGKVNVTEQNVGFLLKELREEQAIFVAHPTERASMAQGLFMVGPGARP